MDRTLIIGNLTRDPECSVTSNGTAVCNFTVAVNKRVRAGEAQQTKFVRVTAWREMAQNCGNYLAKGKKVAVWGTMDAHGYLDQHGQVAVSMEMTADEVEFLTPRSAE